MGRLRTCLVFHLLFACDALLFCDVDGDQLLSVKWILFCFMVVLSLKIDFHKSELILVGDMVNVELLVKILGCELRKSI